MTDLVRIVLTTVLVCLVQSAYHAVRKKIKSKRRANARQTQRGKKQ